MKFFIPERRERKKADVWQIIYMDLMTIIMVFFVILWSINQGSDSGVTNTVGDESARMISLPADILFSTGKANMTGQGQQVFSQLFQDATGSVLDFDTGGLTRRLLVIHGHTDSVGNKMKNFALGYRRALAALAEIERYGQDVSNHVVLCTHADNSPAMETPQFHGEMTPAQRAVLSSANAKNRRITIEDKISSTFEDEE